MTGFSNSGAGFPFVILDGTRIDIVGDDVREDVEDSEDGEDETAEDQP
jgi:hypothetical protein